MKVCHDCIHQEVCKLLGGMMIHAKTYNIGFYWSKFLQGYDMHGVAVIAELCKAYQEESE